jgi:hypothetical protein
MFVIGLIVDTPFSDVQQEDSKSLKKLIALDEFI